MSIRNINNLSVVIIFASFPPRQLELSAVRGGQGSDFYVATPQNDTINVFPGDGGDNAFSINPNTSHLITINLLPSSDQNIELQSRLNRQKENGSDPRDITIISKLDNEITTHYGCYFFTSPDYNGKQAAENVTWTFLSNRTRIQRG